MSDDKHDDTGGVVVHKNHPEETRRLRERATEVLKTVDDRLREYEEGGFWFRRQPTQEGIDWMNETVRMIEALVEERSRGFSPESHGILVEETTSSSIETVQNDDGKLKMMSVQHNISFSHEPMDGS